MLSLATFLGAYIQVKLVCRRTEQTQKREDHSYREDQREMGVGDVSLCV